MAFRDYHETMDAPGLENTLAIIPARMASTRLPGKPLADIAGEAMIVHVWRRAMEAGIGRVVVAAAEPEIADAVRAAGGEAVLTAPDLASGSDRVHAAVAGLDPDGRFAYVVNIQGDLPTIAPETIRACLAPLADPANDIATPVSLITDEAEIGNPNVVKAIARFAHGETVARARDFRRQIEAGDRGPHYHHIGIYAYRRAALDRFVSLPESPREKAARLEQLRALDAGMTIAVALVDTVPFGVDTPADLERARMLLAARERTG